MEVFIFIVIGLVLFLPWKRWLFIDYDDDSSYQKGYDCAIKEIKDGHDPQELFNQCYHSSLSIDRWDKGWLDACENKGAKYP